MHVDEEYAKTTPFDTRVAHGLFGLSLADGLKTRSQYRFVPGMSLGWTWDFKLRSNGAMAQLGMPGQPPPLLRIPVADMYTGVHGVAAVCAALLGRAMSGRGQHIDMAPYDCMISIHDYAVQNITSATAK